MPVCNLNKRPWDHNWKNYSTSASFLIKVTNRVLIAQNIKKYFKKSSYCFIHKNTCFSFLFSRVFYLLSSSKFPLYFICVRNNITTKYQYASIWQNSSSITAPNYLFLSENIFFLLVLLMWLLSISSQLGVKHWDKKTLLYVLQYCFRVLTVF